MSFFERIKRIVDYPVILMGVLAMVLSLSELLPGVCKILSAVAGITGIAYILYGLVLFLLARPRFDWHLINGNYICKVLIVVLLTPFSLALFVNEEAMDGLMSDNHTGSGIEDTVQSCEEPPLFWGVYYHFIDAGNQHMTTSRAGRLWSSVIAILGVFLLNGLLVSSIVGWVDSRKEKWTKGEVRYGGFLRFRRHYVVIGGNDMVPGVVSQLLESGGGCLFKPYLLVQTSCDVESFRRSLFSDLTEAQQKRVAVYYGNRNSRADVQELQLAAAKEVYILGEDTRTDDVESYHDTMNMTCLKLVSDQVSGFVRFKKKNGQDRRLVCRVMFEYQTSFNLFQVSDIDGDSIRFLPFNYYEKWAQNVLICQELEDAGKCRYLPLEGFDGIKADEDSHVHLVVVGMSRMGTAMAVEAAHLAHYPNYDMKRIRTRITFIDTDAAAEKDFFMGRFSELFSLSHWRFGNAAGDELLWVMEHMPCGHGHLGGDFVDVEWEFINGSVEMPGIRRYLTEVSSDVNAKLTVAICLPESNRAIAAAAYLPDPVYRSGSTLQVLVYQRLDDELVRQINGTNRRYNGKMKAFGMARDCYDSQLVGLCESIEGAISAAYDQYMWHMMVLRYRGDGLTDDDLDALTGRTYGSCPEKKDEMRNLCEEWMQSHAGIASFTEVSMEKAVFAASVRKRYGKSLDEDAAGKPKSAKMWSNSYNICSMWTKYRCLTTADGHRFDPLKEDFDGPDSAMMAELGRMEHNRWTVEQLLLRYRPLAPEEQKRAMVPTLYSSSAAKNAFKREYAHLDICSNERLDEIDFNMSGLDRDLIAVLPAAYRKYKLTNK